MPDTPPPPIDYEVLVPILMQRLDAHHAAITALQDKLAAITTTGTGAINCAHINAASVFSHGLLEVIGPSELRGDAFMRGDASVGGKLSVVSDAAIEGHLAVTGNIAAVGNAEAQRIRARESFE